MKKNFKKLINIYNNFFYFYFSTKINDVTNINYLL